MEHSGDMVYVRLQLGNIVSTLKYVDKHLDIHRVLTRLNLWYIVSACVRRHPGLLPTNSFSFTSSGFGSRVFLYVNILSTIGRFIIWSILGGWMVSVGVTKVI